VLFRSNDTFPTSIHVAGAVEICRELIPALAKMRSKLDQQARAWDKLVKIGAKLVTHARYAIFQMAEVAVPRDLFRRILANIADLRCRAPAPC
jgi:hypothetical protein